MNLTAVLVTGMLAGGVSCAAVQGGLLTGLISRQRVAAGETTATGASWSSRLADDLAPVGGFLAGKLVSHALLGALLGGLGAAVQLSIGARTWLQIAAGLLIVVFGLAQLGVPGFRGIVVEPPLSWMRFVRDRSRSQSAVAPAILGFVTVLLPCGVTLSVAALAMASGSVAAGAATMAVFVVGTAPLFTLLGYAARKAATAWKGRLGLITGAAVLAMGLYTLNGGLELAGSPLAASRVAEQIGWNDPPPANVAAESLRGQQVVPISAVTGAYRPTHVRARAGEPTTLLVRSDNAQGCVRTLYLVEIQKETILPVNGETAIPLGKLRPGRLHYTCGMGMYTGVITVEKE